MNNKYLSHSCRTGNPRTNPQTAFLVRKQAKTIRPPLGSLDIPFSGHGLQDSLRHSDNPPLLWPVKIAAAPLLIRIRQHFPKNKTRLVGKDHSSFSSIIHKVYPFRMFTNSELIYISWTLKSTIKSVLISVCQEYLCKTHHRPLNQAMAVQGEKDGISSQTSSGWGPAQPLT